MKLGNNRLKRLPKTSQLELFVISGVRNPETAYIKSLGVASETQRTYHMVDGYIINKKTLLPTWKLDRTQYYRTREDALRVIARLTLRSRVLSRISDAGDEDMERLADMFGVSKDMPWVL